MDTDGLARLLREQDGVIARFQLCSLGAQKHDIDRLLRRRDLARVHTGVYVNHTGRLTDRQVDAAAVLRYWPAALGSFSAVGVAGWRRVPHVIVDVRRTVVSTPGISVSRRSNFHRMARTGSFPPRQRIEEATLDAVQTLDRTDEVFTFLADVIQTRRTTAGRISAALTRRTRVHRRALLEELLADLAVGANSVLEREWLRVEKAHALPVGRRQERFRIAGTRGARDVVYDRYGVIAELDGRGFHDTAAARDADATRDLLAMGRGSATLRLTYGQVFREPCVTAQRVADVLRQRGWAGEVVSCPDC